MLYFNAYIAHEPNSWLGIILFYKPSQLSGHIVRFSLCSGGEELLFHRLCMSLTDMFQPHRNPLRKRKVKPETYTLSERQDSIKAYMR